MQCNPNELIPVLRSRDNHTKNDGNYYHRNVIPSSWASFFFWLLIWSSCPTCIKRESSEYIYMLTLFLKHVYCNTMVWWHKPTWPTLVSSLYFCLIWSSILVDVSFRVYRRYMLSHYHQHLEEWNKDKTLKSSLFLKKIDLIQLELSSGYHKPQIYHLCSQSYIYSESIGFLAGTSGLSIWWDSTVIVIHSQSCHSWQVKK